MFFLSRKRGELISVLVKKSDETKQSANTHTERARKKKRKSELKD
jgi:hypothetical protein